MQKKICQTVLFLVILLGFCFNCAVPRAPEGGPKDQTPPKVKQSMPTNFSTGYNQKHISILFDEFIELKDLQSQLLVSPAPQEMPEINVKGKTLIINFMEELLPNTTYNIYFGDAVADYTEGNVLKDFNFCFSTGSYVDSMQVNGIVRNALTLQPEKNISVMLYTQNIDSLPLTVPPYYLTKTNDAGEFRFRNIQNVSYKIVAVNDANSNKKYDIDESFAFLDSIIYPEYIPLVVNDSIQKDTNVIPIQGKHLVELFLFQQVKTEQLILNSGFTENGVLKISYQIPEKLSVKLLKSTPENVDYTLFYVDSLNVLTCFFKDKNVTFAELLVAGEDGFQDTVKAEFFKKIKVTESKFNIQSNIQSQHDFFKKLELSFNYPIINFDTSKVKLFRVQDSSNVPVQYYWKDSVYKDLVINAVLEEGMEYHLLIDSLCFEDMYTRNNQLLSQAFTSTTQKQYAELSLQMELPNTQNYKLQLIENGRNTVAQEMDINRSQTVNFVHIQPATYQVRIIYDENNNHKWDAGNYNEKRQPEKVKFYPKKITLKANWTITESWKLE